MAQFVKGRLKLTREAINEKKFQVAKDTALQILEYEPENYNAYALYHLIDSKGLFRSSSSETSF